jgi:hypothetical protein
MAIVQVKAETVRMNFVGRGAANIFFILAGVLVKAGIDVDIVS